MAATREDCAVVVMLLLLVMTAVAAGQQRKTKDDFSFEHDADDEVFGFTFPFESARELASPLEDGLSPGLPDRDEGPPPPSGHSDTDHHDRIGTLPIEAHYPHPPNFGALTSPRASPHRGGLNSNAHTSGYRNSAGPALSKKVFNRGGGGFDRISDKIPSKSEISKLPSLHSVRFEAPKPDKIIYSPHEGVKVTYKPKIHQEIRIDQNGGNIEIIQKVPVRRNVPHQSSIPQAHHQSSPISPVKPSYKPAREKILPVKPSYQPAREQVDEHYQPPVYRPRPSKAADPYKSPDIDSSYKQPEITYSVSAAKPKPHKPEFDLYKPSKQVHDPYKPSKPIHDPYKPSKPLHDPYKPLLQPLQPIKPHFNAHKPIEPLHAAHKPDYNPYEPVHDFYEPEYNPYEPDHSPYEPDHSPYKPVKPVHESYKPPTKRLKSVFYDNPKKLEPTYGSAPSRPKQVHDRYKPVHDPHKPHQDELHPEGPYKKSSIPGVPGKDYPTYSQVPYSGFSCANVPYRPGMYANVEANCQAYHVCDDDRYGEKGASFLCTNGTLFNQATFTCDWWYNVDCDRSLQYYDLNLDPEFNPYYQKPYEGPIHVPGYEEEPPQYHDPHQSSLGPQYGPAPSGPSYRHPAPPKFKRSHDQREASKQSVANGTKKPGSSRSSNKELTSHAFRSFSKEESKPYEREFKKQSFNSQTPELFGRNHQRVENSAKSQSINEESTPELTRLHTSSIGKEPSRGNADPLTSFRDEKKNSNSLNRKTATSFSSQSSSPFNRELTRPVSPQVSETSFTHTSDRERHQWSLEKQAPGTQFFERDVPHSSNSESSQSFRSLTSGRESSRPTPEALNSFGAASPRLPTSQSFRVFREEPSLREFRVSENPIIGRGPSLSSNAESSISDSSLKSSFNSDRPTSRPSLRLSSTNQPSNFRTQSSNQFRTKEPSHRSFRSQSSQFREPSLVPFSPSHSSSSPSSPHSFRTPTAHSFSSSGFGFN